MPTRAASTWWRASRRWPRRRSSRTCARTRAGTCCCSRTCPRAGPAGRCTRRRGRRGCRWGRGSRCSRPTSRCRPRGRRTSRTLQSKFKANCRRRRRKLEEKGRVTVERVEGGLDLEAKLEEGFALEASGWKGRRGTAMAQDARTRGFYSELARSAGYAGRLALYYMRLDGRAVAFQYALEYGGRYFLLKPGYDETLGDCSPGQLLMEDVLRDCMSRGLREFDFLGPDMVWKRDWTDKVRRHTWLYVFNDTALGRAMCAAKFRWAPVAREVVAKWKR
ncbi:GNAT family N-acetyltransferase [Archangium gephyra]|uniref:GNAT family N-acetyltransferase n=1 Tax=Archangium gephyra TaxID=48 RepID=UPI003B7A4DC1